MNIPMNHLRGCKTIASKEKGKFGGKNGIDLQRILRPIEPMLPILTNGKADVKISQKMKALDTQVIYINSSLTYIPLSL